MQSLHLEQNQDRLGTSWEAALQRLGVPLKIKWEHEPAVYTHTAKSQLYTPVSIRELCLGQGNHEGVGFIQCGKGNADRKES